jgi:hypothetical protein
MLRVVACWKTGRSLRASAFYPRSAWTFRAGTVENKNTYFRAPQEWEQQESLDPESTIRISGTSFRETCPATSMAKSGLACLSLAAWILAQ